MAALLTQALNNENALKTTQALKATLYTQRGATQGLEQGSSPDGADHFQHEAFEAALYTNRCSAQYTHE